MRETHIDAVKNVAKILFFWNKSKLLIVVVNVVGCIDVEFMKQKNKKISIYRTRLCLKTPCLIHQLSQMGNPHRKKWTKNSLVELLSSRNFRETYLHATRGKIFVFTKCVWPQKIRGLICSFGWIVCWSTIFNPKTRRKNFCQWKKYSKFEISDFINKLILGSISFFVVVFTFHMEFECRKIQRISDNQWNILFEKRTSFIQMGWLRLWKEN